MKSILNTKSVFAFLIFACTFFTMSAQDLLSEIEGRVRVSSNRPRLEMYDTSLGQERIEAWIEIFSSKTYLSSFYDDLVFSAATNGSETERMRIDAATGNVGIGSDDPSQKLHVKDGNVLVEDGAFFILDNNELVFMDNVSGDFSIITPGPAGSTQFYIEDGNGYVGINTDAPQSSIHVKQIGEFQGIRLENTSSTNYWTTYTDGFNDYNFGYNGTLRAYIEDGAGNFIITSDQRLKNSIEKVSTVLDKVMKLNPSTYYYNADESRSCKSWGFLAQEVATVFPEIVREKNGYMGLVYDDFAIISIKAIQEQQIIIDAQADEIKSIKDQLAKLMDAINK